MANIYKNGVYYVNGKPLGAGIDPSAGDPTYTPFQSNASPGSTQYLSEMTKYYGWGNNQAVPQTQTIDYAAGNPNTPAPAPTPSPVSAGTGQQATVQSVPVVPTSPGITPQPKPDTYAPGVVSSLNPYGITPVYDPTAGMPPTEGQPQSTPAQNYQDLYSQIVSMLNNYAQPAQGSAEPYQPDTANSELTQALQDRAMQMLNRQYGYTPEEEAAIWQRQLNQFNATEDQDLQKLQNLYEQYGLNSGAGELGGQAGSSLQDYYGKRAQALADLSGQMGEYFAAKRAGDEQNAVQMATNIQQQVYNQVRGDFQDMLSYLETQETIDNNAFQRSMSLAGYQSDEQQREFLNKLGISDRESQDYWMGVTTAFDQQVQSQQLQDQGLNQLMQYASQFEQTPGDYQNLINALTSQMAGNYTDSMNNTDQQPSAYMLPLALFMNMLQQNMGGNNGNNNNNNPPTYTPQDVYDAGKKVGEYVWDGAKWVFNKITGTTPAPQFVDNNAGNPLVNPLTGLAEGNNNQQYEAPAGPEAPIIPGPIKALGNAIAAYGMYRIGKDTLTGWFGKDKLTTSEAPYAAWTFLKNGDSTKAINTLSALDPLQREYAFAALKEGLYKVGDTTLAPITLDANMQNKFNQKGWLQQWNSATSKLAEELTARIPGENATPDEQLEYMKAMVFEGMFPDKFSAIVPAMTEEQYKKRAAEFVTEGKWTQDQYNKAIAGLANMKEAWG